METLDLTRSPESRRLYRLGALGTIHLNGLVVRSATLTSGGTTFEVTRRGLLSRELTATEAGTRIGAFAPHRLNRGGRLDWRGDELRLEPAAHLAQRYALESRGEALAFLQARGWWGWGSLTPVTVELPDGAAVDGPLLIFAVYVVRTLADRAADDAAGATVASTSSY